MAINLIDIDVASVVIFGDETKRCRACAPKKMRPAEIVAAADAKNPISGGWVIRGNSVFPGGKLQGYPCEDDQECRHWLLEAAK